MSDTCGMNFGDWLCLWMTIAILCWVADAAINEVGEQKRMEIRLISAEIKSFMKPTGEEHE